MLIYPNPTKGDKCAFLGTKLKLWSILDATMNAPITVRLHKMVLGIIFKLLYDAGLDCYYSKVKYKKNNNKNNDTE